LGKKKEKTPIKPRKAIFGNGETKKSALFLSREKKEKKKILKAKHQVSLEKKSPQSGGWQFEKPAIL